jgi:hypothetical protein
MLPPLLEVYAPASPTAVPPPTVSANGAEQAVEAPAAEEPTGPPAQPPFPHDVAALFGEAAGPSVAGQVVGFAATVPVQEPTLGTAGSTAAFMAPSLSGIVTGVGRRMRRAPQVYEAEPAPPPRIARLLAEAKRRCVRVRSPILPGAQ